MDKQTFEDKLKALGTPRNVDLHPDAIPTKTQLVLRLEGTEKQFELLKNHLRTLKIKFKQEN